MTFTNIVIVFFTDMRSFFLKLFFPSYFLFEIPSHLLFFIKTKTYQPLQEIKNIALLTLILFTLT